MTFRGRLRLFFSIIVVVPMFAMAAVLFELTADSERGKTDARLAAGLDGALVSYEDGREAVADHARRIRTGAARHSLPLTSACTQPTRAIGRLRSAHRLGNAL